MGTVMRRNNRWMLYISPSPSTRFNKRFHTWRHFLTDPPTACGYVCWCKHHLNANARPLPIMRNCCCDTNIHTFSAWNVSLLDSILLPVHSKVRISWMAAVLVNWFPCHREWRELANVSSLFRLTARHPIWASKYCPPTYSYLTNQQWQLSRWW